MNGDGRKPGFRFSMVDASIVLIGTVLTFLLRATIGPLSWLLAIVLVHFFLFCNVFRIRRKYELIWAAIFVANVAIQSMRGDIAWQYVLLAQAPASVAFIAMEVASDRFMESDIAGCDDTLESVSCK